MSHICADIKRIENTGICPGKPYGDKHASENQEAAYRKVVAEVIAQKKDHHHMDQIVEQLNPVNVIVSVV